MRSRCDGPAHDSHFAPRARESNHDPKELGGASGKSGRDGCQSFAGVRDVINVDNQAAQCVSSPSYSGGPDTRRKSECGSSCRIKWQRGLCKRNFAKYRRGALQRARAPKQTSSTLDGLHASSVVVAEEAAYIVWWLCDANRCSGLDCLLLRQQPGGETLPFADPLDLDSGRLDDLFDAR